jgi:hypothetical protein
VHRDALLALGYNFSFFTHTIETTSGELIRFCFEYGYSENLNDFIDLKFNGEFLEYC